ncbi:MAG TPA: hypothetical protein VF820_00040 [Patescibacteria group bacterium]
MRIPSDTHEKILAAFQMLQGSTISVSTFENIRTIVKGISPEIDKKLEICSKALDKVQKIEQMDVISLAAEQLPEDTEKKKKKKKAIIFFIASLKDLRSEINRISKEFNQQTSQNNSFISWGRIIKFAKGPFGLVTLAAIIIVSVMVLTNKHTKSVQQEVMPTSVPKNQIQVIMYNGKEIPLSQLYVGHGADCDSPHYHATSGFVITVDGIKIQDPEGCGFGKVANVQIQTISR